MQYEVITTYPVLRRKKKSPLNDFGWQQLHPARGRPDGSLLFDKVVLPRSVSILDSTGDLFDRECRARTVYGSGAGNITRPVLKIKLYKTPPGHFRTPEGRFSTVLTPGKLRVFQSIKAIRKVERGTFAYDPHCVMGCCVVCNSRTTRAKETQFPSNIHPLYSSLPQAGDKPFQGRVF